MDRQHGWREQPAQQLAAQPSLHTAAAPQGTVQVGRAVACRTALGPDTVTGRACCSPGHVATARALLGERSRVLAVVSWAVCG